MPTSLCTPLSLTVPTKALTAYAKLSAAHKKQMRALLTGEGLGTPAAARKSDPDLEIWCCDVLDAEGVPRFQHYAWSGGSGLLFRDGTVQVVAGLSQHQFEFEEVDDLPLFRALAEAFVDAPSVLQTPEFDESDRGPRTPAAPAHEENVDARIAALVMPPRDDLAAAWTAVQRRDALAKHFWPECYSGTGRPKRRPYPLRRPGDLRPQERAFLLRLRQLGWVDTPAPSTGFVPNVYMPRFLGVASAGPLDALVQTQNGARLPLFCAVSDVASGHAQHADVLAGFSALSHKVGVGAWLELVDGVYGCLDPQALTWPDDAKESPPSSRKYLARLSKWMADACVALGSIGRNAAMAAKLATPVAENDFQRKALLARVTILDLALARR